MKIVQVITSLNLGGAQTLLENLSYGLQQAGQQVTVISLENNHSATARRIESQGIKVIYLDKHPHFDSSIVGKLADVLKMLHPDIIHAHNIKKAYVYLAARKAGIKRIVYTVHNMAWQEQNRIGGIFSYFMFHAGCMVPVGISPKVSDSIKKRYHLAGIPTIYNGTDLSRFQARTDYSLHNPPCIINIARLDGQKNHRRLIEAFVGIVPFYPDAHLVLVGDGELQGELEKQVEQAGLAGRVLFEGLQEDIPGYLRNADIFCLSSDYEGMPMTLIEAMASGIPIVSTNVGGVPDMLMNEKSAILTGLEAEELTTAIIRLLEEASLRKKLGYNAAAAVKKFSHLYMAQRYLSLYKKMCSRIKQK